MAERVIVHLCDALIKFIRYFNESEHCVSFWRKSVVIMNISIYFHRHLMISREEGHLIGILIITLTDTFIFLD